MGHFLCFKNIAFVKFTFLNRIEERVLIHSCASSSLDRIFSISYLLISDCAGSSLLHGLFPSCRILASQYSGFSCCAAQALEHEGFSSCSSWAQQLWCMGLAAPWQVKSSQTRNQTRVPCIGTWILNHWTTGEIPFLFHLNEAPHLA